MTPPVFVNLGSLNIDLVFRVEDFARPGETITSISTERHPGGKGLNQSVALARAGATVYHAGCLGADGHWLRDVLLGEGVDVGMLRTVDTLTGLAAIQVRGDGENSIVLSPGANHAVDPGAVAALLGSLSGRCWFLCQNETNGVAEGMAAARAAGCVVCVNPAPMSESAKSLPYEIADWVILNETEAAGLLGETGLEAVLNKWKRLFPSTSLVLTLGAQGAVGFHDGVTCHQVAMPAKVVDTTAAGDTFVGFLLNSLASGASLADSLLCAAQAAALCVGRPGAAPSIPFARELPG